MNWHSCCEYIKADLSRMTVPSIRSAIKYLICNASFKVTFWFRLSSLTRGVFY